MYPLFSYAPRVQFPWSGNVTQDIAAEAFFGAIKPEAGVGAIEKEVFELASYGRQLGLITEVLLSLADPAAIAPEQRDKSLARLKEIRAKVEEVKNRNKNRLADAAIHLLEKLRESDEAEFRRVLGRF